MQNCCCGMNRLYVKVKERLGGSPNHHHGTSPGPSIRKISGPRSQSVERHYSPAAIESESIERNGDYLSGGLTKFPISAPGTPRTPRLGGLHPNYASKRKPEVNFRIGFKNFKVQTDFVRFNLRRVVLRIIWICLETCEVSLDDFLFDARKVLNSKATKSF